LASRTIEQRAPLEKATSGGLANRRAAA